jgi:hypothetical protein
MNSTRTVKAQKKNRKMKNSKRDQRGKGSLTNVPIMYKNPRSNDPGFYGLNPNPSQIGPPVTTSYLTYQSDLTSIGGADYVVKAFQFCLNDFDPAIFSTSIAGIERFSNYYYEYLNKWVTCDVRSTNTAGQPVNFFMHLDTADLTSVIATWQQAKDLAENPNSTRVLTWENNVDTKRQVQRFYPATLMPPGVYQFSEIYAGLYNANPVSPIFLNLVWYSTQSGNSVRVETDIKFFIKSLWYIQRAQSDSGPLLNRRARSLYSTYQMSPLDKEINKKNAKAWGYSGTATRRVYDHLAGQEIMKRESKVILKNQQLETVVPDVSATNQANPTIYVKERYGQGFDMETQLRRPGGGV